MKNCLRCFLLLMTGMLLSFGAMAQAPTPLDSAAFPHPMDSVFVRTSRIPPTESFTDTVSANDTLTVDRCLQKAIQSLGDTYMEDIQVGGSAQAWTVVTFYYAALPNPNNWTKVWRKPNAFVPGASSFPTANLYYEGVTSGLTTYNFFEKNPTGFYELGSRVMDATPYTVMNTPKKPGVLFPVDYSFPANISGQSIVSVASTITTNSLYDVTVDAYGTVTLVTGSIATPIYTDYTNCLRTVTSSIDTMDAGSGMLFFLKTKIYNWYAPGISEPLVTYSVSQVRNNLDPLFWSIDPGLAWHDELEMSYITLFTGAGVENRPATSINVYPNPCKGLIHFLVPESFVSEQVKIELIDVTGRCVQSEIMNIDTPLQQWQLKETIPGVYILKIQSGEEVLSTTIEVQ